MNSQNITSSSGDYGKWLGDLKTRFRQVQIKAAIAVNSELLRFYWELGAEIVERQERHGYGSGLLAQLSKDLRLEFPEMKGFSERNLQQICQWHRYWAAALRNPLQPVADLKPQVRPQKQANTEFVQQVVAQMGGKTADPIWQQLVSKLVSIPWGHNLTIISKCKNPDEAMFYVWKTMEHNWSRVVLTHQIENGLYGREGKGVNNFAHTLPAAQSELARDLLKDPYIFDFLSLSGEYSERELENALVEQVTKFLLELGDGFAFMGRQVPIQVGSREFFIDMLFYHVRLRCYVVVELKTRDFEPEFTGKLNFYLKAVDEIKRTEGDARTIGILLCKGKDKLVAEYALSDIDKPLGLANYELPGELQGKLPSIEAIEQGLQARL